MITQTFLSSSQDRPNGYQLFRKTSNHVQNSLNELKTISGGPSNMEWAKKMMELSAMLDQIFRSTPPEGYYQLPKEEQKKFVDLFSYRWGGDKIPQAGLREVLRHHEWVSIPEFGERLNKAALLIAIHSDHDKEFQRRVLALLEEKYMDPKLSALGGYAHLYDRHCIAYKKHESKDLLWEIAVHPEKSSPTRYGSQGQIGPHGYWQPLEIEDFDGVDKRREAFGMDSLRSYFKRINDGIYNVDGIEPTHLLLTTPPIIKPTPPSVDPTV